MSKSRIEIQVNEFKNNNNLALVGSWVKFRDINDKIIKEKFFKKIHLIFMLTTIK
jgi:hypothetical protein